MHGKIKDTNRMMYQTGVSSMKMDYRQICKNEEISLLIEKGNEILHELGYTEHSRKHAMKVAERSWDTANGR